MKQETVDIINNHMKEITKDGDWKYPVFYGELPWYQFGKLRFIILIWWLEFKRWLRLRGWIKK